MNKGQKFVLVLGILGALAGIYLIFTDNMTVGISGFVSSIGLIYVSLNQKKESDKTV